MKQLTSLLRTPNAYNFGNDWAYALGEVIGI
jgi:hypothetical protein